MRRTKKLRKLLLRPVQHILREQPAAWAKFEDFDLVRRTQNAPHLFKLTRHQPPENRVDVTRRVEVASLAELLRIARVVTQLWIVQAKLHIARKRDRPMLTDFLENFLAQGHRPSR